MTLHFKNRIEGSRSIELHRLPVVLDTDPLVARLIEILATNGRIDAYECHQILFGFSPESAHFT